jgi:hypothetical protein
MEPTERQELKEQLRVMAAGRGDGIDLDSPDRWVIKGLQDAPAFFRHIQEIIPNDSILYFEGCAIIPEVAAYYEKHRARNAVSVVRDTIYPIPTSYHVSLSPEVVDQLVGFLSDHSTNECFDHVKAYRESTLLFAFHDAFDGSYFLVSDRVSESQIKVFCRNLNAEYDREKNENKRDPEQLRRFLWALENPEKLRINWPWWKKILFFWKKGGRIRFEQDK